MYTNILRLMSNDLLSSTKLHKYQDVLKMFYENTLLTKLYLKYITNKQ